MTAQASPALKAPYGRYSADGRPRDITTDILVEWLRVNGPRPVLHRGSALYGPLIDHMED